MIRQFTVFANPSTTNRQHAPYVLVLQSHFFEALDTVIVAPLVRYAVTIKPNEVMVRVDVASESFMLDVTSMANIERSLLSSPAGNLRDYEDEIRRALDRLFTGC